MPEFQPFAMERMMSKYEKEVEFNLSESGVHPVVLRELLQRRSGSLEKLLEVDLNYPHANGTPALRERIARLYAGAGPENILVTIGAIEANYNAIRTLLEPGEEIVVQPPQLHADLGPVPQPPTETQEFQSARGTGLAARSG